MNENFVSFVQQSKKIAVAAGLDWTMPLDESGVALKEAPWNLRVLVKDGKPSTYVLRTFSKVEAAHTRLALRQCIATPFTLQPVSTGWQDLIKTFAIEYRIVRQKSSSFVAAGAEALRFLATTSSREPWDITADDIQLACELSDEDQPSFGRSNVLRAIIGNLIDPLHLFDACPISALVARPIVDRKDRAKFAERAAKQPKTLTERKAEEKLPERKAFWEIVRIVFTKQPKTINDALRFALVKILLLTGMRIEEAVLIPLDWKRTRAYMTKDGQPAGVVGGISESLSIRHFAGKKGKVNLFEESQPVPELFRDELEATLREVERLTAPLRTTLRAQYETGRIFPMYGIDELVDSVEMYVRLTGNPVWAGAPIGSEVQQCIASYYETLDASLLLDLGHLQQSATSLTPTISRYFSRQRRAEGLIPRRRDGSPVVGTGIRGTYLRVGEVESYVRSKLKTKLSDLRPFVLNNGSELPPWEMLFLMPKRAVGEGRGQTIMDPNMTCAVGIADPQLLQVVLGADSAKEKSLFSNYGMNETDYLLHIISHSLRHLQNTELFRLGVADTIIAKRFNRSSVAQSYEYDHRSLAEELDQVSLPNEWELMIGDSQASTVAKMIQAGRANGPIVREFKRIQTEEGDRPALEFLAAEADGFHATPYGTCLNSFTVDPCPKHLECFDGCRHLSATNLPEHQRNILTLHGKLKIALDQALARPEGSIGRANQIAHATDRIAGVEKLISTLPGCSVFPDGKDLSSPTQRESVLHGA